MYKNLVLISVFMLAMSGTVMVQATEQLGSTLETPAKPAAAPTSALLTLRHKLKRFEQFSAQFEQKVFDVKGQQIQTSKGELQVQQPNKFRWQTYEPDQNLIVSDGQAVWIYNAFVEQVTAMELNKTVQQSPLWLIANQSEQAWSQFDVSTNQQGYSIVPKDPNSLTKRIIIRFNDDIISRLTIEDTQGQTSEFILSDFNASSRLANDIFNFTLPDGVEFDDQREVK